MKNPTVVPKPANLMFQRSYVTSSCIKLKLKILPSVIGIGHFLDTRTIEIEARNYVVVTSLQW